MRGKGSSSGQSQWPWPWECRADKVTPLNYVALALHDFLPAEEGELPLRKGERVYVSLGAKPNSQLLTNYGFVLRDNPYDTVLLSMQLDEKVSGMMMMMPAPRISS